MFVLSFVLVVVAGSTGVGFTPHILTVSTGEVSLSS